MKAIQILKDILRNPELSPIGMGIFRWDEESDIIGQFCAEDETLIIRKDFRPGEYVYSYNIEFGTKQKPENIIWAGDEVVYLYLIEE